MQSSVNLMMSPVCRKFPGLKFVFSEGGIGWLPNALERADRMWLRHKAYNDFDDTLPSDIYRQNMYLCMIEEPICLKYRDDIGIDKIMWECDYPHTDTVWPDSQESARRGVRTRRVHARRDRRHQPRQRRTRLQLDDGIGRTGHHRHRRRLTPDDPSTRRRGQRSGPHIRPRT